MIAARRTFLAATGAALLCAQRAFAQDVRTLAVAGVPEESITPALWAEQSGIFTHYGLNLQLEPQRSGSAIASGVAGGAYAIGKSSLVALIAAHAHGVPFVLVAPGGLYDSARPNMGVLVKNDSPIRAAADLNGKTIGVSSIGDLFTLSAQAWVDQHGGDASTLKLVELPIAALGAALGIGRIDAAPVGTPQYEEFLEAGDRVIGHSFDAIAPQFMFSAWFTTTQYLNDNRATVAAFAHAMRESAAYVNGHQAQTVDVLAKFTAVAPAVIAKMPRATMGTALLPRYVQPVIDVCAKYKQIPAAFDATEFITAL